ncbi:hypothetical protein GGU11DRAFT_761270 [Lentinula aff. detonsa]|nr:hypothetical protein GGU11DRAFT_761270 [Lentinula aff. detonsa]
MLSTPKTTKTAQQCRKHLTLAQAEHQRARDEEIARQEAEFAAEMERLEEEVAREEEERQLAKEQQRIAEEKRIAKTKVAEEKRSAEEKHVNEEKLAEEKRVEEERVAAEKRRAEVAAASKRRNTALNQLLENSCEQKEKAARELEKRREQAPPTKRTAVTVMIPPRVSVISDESDDVAVDEEPEGTLQGVKRKQPIKMIARTKRNPLPPPNLVRHACDAFYLVNPRHVIPNQRNNKLRHRQRCSWIEAHASRQSRGKWTKIEEDEVYKGPASRVAARTFGGPEVLERFAGIEHRLLELERYASRLTKALKRKEKRELGAMGGNEEGDEEEEEDKDGEGEEDEEEENNEEKRRAKIHEGKQRAE